MRVTEAFEIEPITRHSSHTCDGLGAFRHPALVLHSSSSFPPSGLEVEVKKLRNDAEEAKSKLARREADMKNFERKLESREKELADLRLDHDRYKVRLRPSRAAELPLISLMCSEESGRVLEQERLDK